MYRYVDFNSSKKPTFMLFYRVVRDKKVPCCPLPSPIHLLLTLLLNQNPPTHLNLCSLLLCALDSVGPWITLYLVFGWFPKKKRKWGVCICMKGLSYNFYVHFLLLLASKFKWISFYFTCVIVLSDEGLPHLKLFFFSGTVICASPCCVAASCLTSPSDSLFTAGSVLFSACGC